MKNDILQSLQSKLLAEINSTSKIHIIEEMANYLEYALLHQIKLDADTLRAAMKNLIYCLLSEDDKELRESLLNALMNASSLASLNKVFYDFDELVSNNKFCNEELEYVLWILAFSRNPKYIPFIKTYLVHPDKDIRETAEQTYNEISKSS